MLAWDDTSSFVKGATPSVRRAWQELGIRTVGDLLQTPPRRYDDFSKSVAVRDANHGDVVTLRVKAVKASQLPSFRKRLRIIRATFEDATGRIHATFFNQPWLLQEFLPGREVVLSGKVVIHPTYGKSMANPLWEPATDATVAAGKLAPVYPLSGSLAQKTYRRLVVSALENVAWPPESLEHAVLDRIRLLPFAEAVIAIHRPKDAADAEAGRRRLAFDELFAYQLAIRQAGQEAETAGAVAIPFDQTFAKRFVASLPFPFTDDQKRAAWACLQDMAKEQPMRRLLLGDVGSGKTVIAAFLAAHVQRSGHSAAMLAPTDVLAKQHAETMRRFLAPHHAPLLLITRTQKRLYGAEARELSASETLDRIAQGTLVVVGTHAILEANRLPPDLVLAIVDEQHRFGVDQREALTLARRPDGKAPHFLSMTATPIPRSLALTFYGDLEVSTLKEKPSGRLPVATRVVVGNERDDAYEAIRGAARRRERAFIVCPLIDPSDALGVRAATDEATRLAKGPLKGLHIGVLHGRLKPTEKDAVMEKFAAGELDALVATSVIEVGVDIPEATVILIEGAERFGLAQLHQLRGRVGRSSKPSACFLATDAADEALSRLRVVERTQDGFALAEADLKLRGAGNLLGTAQSGHATFKAARTTDADLMMGAREAAETLLRDDPALERDTAWKTRVEELRATAHME